jgi:cation:H+ antiporter
MRAAFSYEHRSRPAETVTGKPLTISLHAALARYAVAAVAVAAAGTWLPFIGVNIAEAMGWRTSFVGTLFIAGATSLPEFVVTIGALRIGALDMAIANLLGSNLFDILVLAVDDLAYVRGPLLSAVSPIPRLPPSRCRASLSSRLFTVRRRASMERSAGRALRWRSSICSALI